MTVKVTPTHFWQAFSTAVSFWGLYSAGLFIWSELQKPEATGNTTRLKDNHNSQRDKAQFVKWKP